MYSWMCNVYSSGTKRVNNLKGLKKCVSYCIKHCIGALTRKATVIECIRYVGYDVTIAKFPQLRFIKE